MPLYLGLENFITDLYQRLTGSYNKAKFDLDLKQNKLALWKLASLMLAVLKRCPAEQIKAQFDPRILVVDLSPIKQVYALEEQWFTGYKQFVTVACTNADEKVSEQLYNRLVKIEYDNHQLLKKAQLNKIKLSSSCYFDQELLTYIVKTGSRYATMAAQLGKTEAALMDRIHQNSEDVYDWFEPISISSQSWDLDYVWRDDLAQLVGKIQQLVEAGKLQ